MRQSRICQRKVIDEGAIQFGQSAEVSELILGGEFVEVDLNQVERCLGQCLTGFDTLVTTGAERSDNDVAIVLENPLCSTAISLCLGISRRW